MAQPKGLYLTFVVALLLSVMVQWERAQAATHVVGGNAGWNFNEEGWPAGKTFKPGDVLQFKYEAGFHNVAAFHERSGYDSCKAPADAKVFQTGNDQIQLQKGENYFICTIPGHCQGGMRIAVTAS